jgi:hypothetical protein
MLAGSPAEFPTPWRSADRRCASPTVVLFAAEVKSSTHSNRGYRIEGAESWRV